MEKTLRPFCAYGVLVDHALFEDAVFDDDERVVWTVVDYALVAVFTLVIVRKIGLGNEVEPFRQNDAEDLFARPQFLWL